LDHLYSSVRHDLKAPVDVLAYTKENIDQVIQNYIQKISSPSLKICFEKMQIVEMGEVIRIKVSSQLDRQTILNETAWLDELRNKFNKNDIQLAIEVEESAPEERPAQRVKLTEQDILEIMIKRNPLVSELVKIFDAQ
jgi:hypothetical protein